MKDYNEQLKKLTDNFSYNEFIRLLNEIDNEILNGNLQSFDQEFINNFQNIISMENDNNTLGTLGHNLVENALLNKQKLTPTQMMCFFLEEKRKLGLEKICNNISFKEGYGDMHINSGEDLLNINPVNLDKTSSETVDEYNYSIMENLLHEITHIYQGTRPENSESTFDRLVGYDWDQKSILLTLGQASKGIVHDSLMTEFMADEQARIYMLQIAKNHPEYFNEELIANKKKKYQYERNGEDGGTSSNPRNAFKELVSQLEIYNKDIQNSSGITKQFVSMMISNMFETNDQTIIQEYDTIIPEILTKIEELEQKKESLIEELQKYGFSEKAYDLYYNIYLRQLYQFDGEEIVFKGDAKDIFFSKEEKKNNGEPQKEMDIAKSKVENQERDDEGIEPIDESKFAQIYGKAKGRIKEVFSKIKSFLNIKSNDRNDKTNDENIK